MSEALRFNNDKPMMSYFMRSFPRMAEAVARVKEMGAIKYNDGNWRLGNKPDKEYLDSLFRHLNYINIGEDYDSDTGCLHIAHAVWNLCALLELNYPDLPARDDEIWADRAEHWAEEKRKREATDEVETVEQMGADMVACWAAEAGEEKREDSDECRVAPPQGSLEKFVAAMKKVNAMMADMFFSECPMCGRYNTGNRSDLQGLECYGCGEIYAVPIGPENEAGEVVEEPVPLLVAEPTLPKGVKFVIRDSSRSPLLAKLMDDYFGKPWGV